MAPKILLSAKSKMENYADAVTQCGGIADIRYLPEVDLNYDGLILCGGSDIHPRRFGEEIDGSVKIDEDRDAVEFDLAKAYIEAGKPVMGICRGFQLLNIYFGGSLYQDIPNAAEHRSYPEGDSVHGVEAIADSVLAKLYGTSFAVNSAHHQALKKIGNGLRITAWSADHTVVEAVEHASLPVFGVQWHPERMCFSKKREDTVDGAALFEYFMKLCK